MIQHVALPSRIPITALRILLEDGWLVVGIPSSSDDRYLLSKDVEPGWDLAGNTWDERGVAVLGRIGIALAGRPEPQS